MTCRACLIGRVSIDEIRARTGTHDDDGLSRTLAEDIGARPLGDRADAEEKENVAVN